MNNIVIIGSLPINISTIKKKFPTLRWILYSNNEEALAAISIYGHLFTVIFIQIDTTFMPSIDMYTTIKKQHPNLPTFIFKNTTDILGIKNLIQT